MATKLGELSSWLGFCFVDSITIVTWFNATRIAAECYRKLMRFDSPDKRRLKLKLKLKLKLRSRAHLGWQLVARLLTTSHHSPPPLYIHTHSQADCQAWPMWFCAPLAASPRNSPWVIETHFDCCFRSLYVATFWFVSLLLFISLAWVSLGFGLAFWPRESFAPLLLPGHFAAIIKQIKECHCIRLAYTKQQVACCLSHCLAVSEFVSRSLDWTGSQSLTLNRLT